MKGEYQHIHRELILKCQSQDRKAQEDIYKLYGRAMYNICRRMIGNEEEAMDILMESFTDAFEKLPSLRDVNTFSSWLKRIVTNNCINLIRKRRIFFIELDDRLDVKEEDVDLDYTRYQAEQIMQAIDRLPDGCKTVLTMYLFEGYDHKEIAQVLAITESASKAQFSKAKARIREILNDQKQQYV